MQLKTKEKKIKKMRRKMIKSKAMLVKMMCKEMTGRWRNW